MLTNKIWLWYKTTRPCIYIREFCLLVCTHTSERAERAPSCLLIYSISEQCNELWWNVTNYLAYAKVVFIVRYAMRCIRLAKQKVRIKCINSTTCKLKRGNGKTDRIWVQHLLFIMVLLLSLKQRVSWARIIHEYLSIWTIKIWPQVNLNKCRGLCWGPKGLLGLSREPKNICK